MNYEAEDGFCIAPFGIQESLRFTVVAMKGCSGDWAQLNPFYNSSSALCVRELVWNVVNDEWGHSNCSSRDRRNRNTILGPVEFSSSES